MHLRTTTNEPLIKGVFVNSHIKRLRNEQGGRAIEELENRYGKSIEFDNMDDVPVREEVVLLEIILELLGRAPRNPTKRSFEAGRLHFENFAHTAFGSTLLAPLPKTPEGFEKLLLSTPYFIHYIFKNLTVKTRRLEDGVQIATENSDYPPEHVRGLFYEWATYWQLRNISVTVRKTTLHSVEYTITYDAYVIPSSHKHKNTGSLS